MATATETTTVEEQATTPARLWHICTRRCPAGTCGPGCVSYCGREWFNGARSRSKNGVAPIDICVICQDLEGGLHG
jgi:hypothetical protein